ncbi:uncharacterized protein EAE98_006567 [Botrytis deweyae]|uniref:FAD-binding PCMH-type domain-containing protein n=1 Tax=Botrytis deweyae TaxID=2478750 RepID=A0ABQ7IK40_9HELO|nr:uncharacterized protein EAE98_006567 [Botrytis deweyae]KAF7926272.1 hypothetical protein EAE98_006567 [Botrytis deweyae]
MNCSVFSINLPGQVFLPGSVQYAASKASYFAAFENELSPARFIQPNSTAEVAEVIKQSQSDRSVSTAKLAIRSGGHTPWAGSGNIQSGITIELSRLIEVTLNSKTNIVSVGVGNSWGNVYKFLSDKGLAIVGGRVSTVGVGGLTLGGGLSFFSAETGFVCDNVVNFEVVLASGEIVQANATSHPDLFIALKGGSNNFGVVTKIDFPTFEQGQMWGGSIFFEKSAYPSLIQSFYNFATNTTPDLKAHVIVSSAWIGGGTGELATANLYHTTPIADPPSLKPFAEAQPQLQSTLRNDSLLGFTEEQSTYAKNGDRQWFFTTSFRLDEQLMLDIHQLWLDAVSGMNQTGLSIALVYQPVIKSLISNSLKAGVNSLGLNVSDGPFVVCLLDAVFIDSTLDDTISAAMLRLVGDIDALAAKRNLSSEYKFLNYAFNSQSVIEGYGKQSIARLKSTSELYDPTQFFQERVPGGFKLTSVDC